MNRDDWREDLLRQLESCCEEGKAAADFLRARGTRIRFRRARRNVGAFWTLTGAVYFNARHYSPEAALRYPSAWSLLIHEACHIRQGWRVAFSIYGELEAWQIQWRVAQKINGEKKLSAPLEELLALPLNMDLNVLRRARRLMTDFAGFGYGAYFYPLRPLFGRRGL